MDEAAVHLCSLVDVPEGFGEVVVIQVSVAAEHLFDDGLDVGMEMCWEARGLSDPLVLVASRRGEGLVEVGGRHANRRGRTGIANVTGDEGLFDGKRRRSGEGLFVMDLADEPPLNPNNVMRRRDLSRASILKPGVGQARQESAVSQKVVNRSAYRPADIVGHCCSLQMGSPTLRSTS